MKKLVGAVLATMLAVALCVPAMSFADTSSNAKTQQSSHPAATESAVQSALAEQEAGAAGQSAEAQATASSEALGNCTATIKYYEIVSCPEPGYEPDEDGRWLLGSRTITGLSEGDVLDAWDYVVDIKGFFFFDGWPAKLTVTTDPSKNVIELSYFREWSSSYTVNYYLMVGADLTADTWAGALAPSGVEFIKFDTETFENQPYGMLVEGDAYEYRLDGTYVVDTYPPSIRVGTDIDNNTLNVLYVPDSAHLPDDFEIDDDLFSIEGGDQGGSSDGVTGGTGSTPNLPADEVISKDEMVGLLPDGLTEQEIDQLFKDFIGSQADAGQLEITDEMLANPVDREVAMERIAAYRAGYERGLAQGDQQVEQIAQQSEETTFMHWICIILIILLLIVSIIGYVLFVRERKRNGKLQQTLDAFEGADGETGTAAQ